MKMSVWIQGRAKDRNKERNSERKRTEEINKRKDGKQEGRKRERKKNEREGRRGGRRGRRGGGDRNMGRRHTLLPGSFTAVCRHAGMSYVPYHICPGVP